MLNARSRSPQKSPFFLTQLFRQFRAQILLTFGLLLIENALNVLQPFVFGLAINDLLEQSLRGTIWIAISYVSKLLISLGRRLYDTRIYSKIYSTTAVDMIQCQTALNAPISAIAVRSNLVKELIDFFEVHLTQGFTAFVSVIGVVLILLVYNSYLFAGCLLAAVCVNLIFQKSERLTFRFNRDLNDELEQQINVVAAGSSSAIL
ncbi:MAG: ABC transporter six-transmembrane domain-containing protein [Cyanobacteria bacterium P01_G01_bin.38]